jgi:hypothetical protein
MYDFLTNSYPYKQPFCSVNRKSYHAQRELPLDQQLEGHDLVAQLLQSEQLNRSNDKTAYY